MAEYYVVIDKEKDEVRVSDDTMRRINGFTDIVILIDEKEKYAVLRRYYDPCFEGLQYIASGRRAEKTVIFEIPFAVKELADVLGIDEKGWIDLGENDFTEENEPGWEVQLTGKMVKPLKPKPEQVQPDPDSQEAPQESEVRDNDLLSLPNGPQSAER